MNKKYYELTVAAKEIVSTLLKDNDPEDVIEMARDFVYGNETNSINKKAAIVAVLCTGVIYNRFQFMMPATDAVLSNFRYYRNRLSKGWRCEIETITRLYDGSEVTHRIKL